MKYVALLSGGKDSCYNLLHCHQHRHELIAAASLGPEHGKEELDSYLYQTVGQDAIELVARALDVPLYRRVISGTAVEQGPEYGGRNANDRNGPKEDETEDLYALLSDVKSQHPDVQGVSVGAILSSYQRVRVEHVCRRLGLTPLCYLWQRNQAELLSEMISAGMEAILIKVAGIGLETKHLGKTLTQMQPTLTKLNTLYGSHICGEGGEYETLTLDCPLFKQRIILTDTETVIHSDNDFATVAFMRIKDARLDPKPEQTAIDVPVPNLLEEDFLHFERSITASQALQDQPSATTILPVEADLSPLESPAPSVRRSGDWVALGNIHRAVTAKTTDITLEEEVKECFEILREHLDEQGLRFSHLSNVNILISSLEFFGPLNAVYGHFFGTSPPARACVIVDLPSPLRILLDCTAFVEHKPTDRQALHVQGLSYWSPANIGPYSQAITVGERIFISGQIGLNPSSLSLPSPKSLGLETALASQHVIRVARALKGSADETGPHAQMLLYWLAERSDVVHVKNAHVSSNQADIPTLFLAIKDLPKGALIEKQVLYHTGKQCIVDEEGEGTVVTEASVHVRGELSDGSPTVEWQASHLPHGTASFAIISGRRENGPILRDLQNVTELSRLFEGALSTRLFYRSGWKPPLVMFETLFGANQPALTPIACRLISTATQDDWDYALCIIAN